MLRQIKPTVPMTAKTIEKELRTFSLVVMFLANRPRCRSQRSDKKDRSRKAVVTTQPAMNNGFRPSAPTSEMYAMV